MGFFIPLLYFLLANATIVFVAQRRFGHCIPIAFISTCLLLYIGTMASGSFYFGTALCGMLALAIVPLLCTAWILSRIYSTHTELNQTKITKYLDIRFRSFKGNYFCCTLVAFITLYCFVYVLDYKSSFSAWDEFSHWGPMVKETLRLGTFSSDPNSLAVVHKDYPPLIQLFESLYCILSKGAYLESYLYKAIHLLIFSLFLFPIEDGLKTAPPASLNKDSSHLSHTRNRAFHLPPRSCWLLMLQLNLS